MEGIGQQHGMADSNNGTRLLLRVEDSEYQELVAKPLHVTHVEVSIVLIRADLGQPFLPYLIESVLFRRRLMSPLSICLAHLPIYYLQFMAKAILPASTTELIIEIERDSLNRLLLPIKE